MFKDLTAIQETSTPFCDEEKRVINFERMLQIERSVRGFYAQSTAYGIEEQPNIHQWLLNIAPPPSADELYQQSLQIEPLRSSKTVEQQLQEAKTQLQAARQEKEALQRKLDAGLTVLDLLIQNEPDHRALKAVKNALQGQFVVDLATAAENAAEDLLPVTQRSMTLEDAEARLPSRKGPPQAGNRGTVQLTRRRPPPRPSAARSTRFNRSPTVVVNPRARIGRTKSDEAPMHSKIVVPKRNRRPKDC